MIVVFKKLITKTTKHDIFWVLKYQINMTKSQRKIQTAVSLKRKSASICTPAEAASLFIHIFPYLSPGKADDDTQQALALGEVIKMFINTDPSR